MGLVNMRDMLDRARAGGYAVGAFSYCNGETAEAAVEEGVSLRSPVLMISAGIELELLGPAMAVRILGWLADGAGVPVCLHLDHADSLELVRACIEAGFPSVMIDGSRHDFEANVRLTRQAVDMAHPRGVTVEGELGFVGRVGDATPEGAGRAALTEPDDAARFVELTGVDALAVSVGNAHGLYTKLPVLDIDRITAIRRAVEVPLVLHGGSGTPPDQLHRAVAAGIVKVNVASEIARAYLDAVERTDAEKGGKLWYSLVLKEGKAAARGVIGRWMRELGSAGRA